MRKPLADCSGMFSMIMHQGFSTRTSYPVTRFLTRGMLPSPSWPRPNARVKDLVALLNKFELIGELLEVQENQNTAMRLMCLVMNWPLPEEFSLTPVNSPACLIHWRALTALLQNLSPNVREDLQGTFSEPQSEDASAPVG